MLHVPAAFAELHGEPVEQFRMRRPLALRAEFIDLRAERVAEELLPEPVHKDARGERVLGRDEPVRQIEPRETMAVRRLELRLEKARRRGRDDFAAFVLPVSARQHAGDRRFHGFRHHDLRATAAAFENVALNPLQIRERRAVGGGAPEVILDQCRIRRLRENRGAQRIVRQGERLEPAKR